MKTTPKASHAAEKRLELTAKPRATIGTRSQRRLRHDGFVPGIVYGKKLEPTPVVVDRRALVKLLHARGGEHGLVTLKLEAEKAWEKPVLIKHLQHHPVDGSVLHIDFHAIALTEQIRVKVAIVLDGQPVGVKQDGGILEHFLREIEVECLPTEIPKQFQHDVSAMKIGEAIHVKDLAVPAGVRIMTDVESVVASVLVPKEEKPEEVVEAVTEPEVIREKKPEAEGEGEAAEGKGEKKAEPKAEKKEEKK